jgi:nucleoside-diphosphate-sugar epimerase
MKVLITGGSGFIGINLIEYLLDNNIDFLNIDIKLPEKSSQAQYCTKVDIMDKAQLNQAFKEYKPTHVIHLAARTDTDSDVLEDYKTNTEGTANVLEAIKITPSIERVIITSTQFVLKPGPLPKSDIDFDPHTTYGQSKVITEKLTRDANFACCWTLIRPTNVWGPWHPRYPKEFWRVLRKGIYFHPGKKPVIRSYAYIGNVVNQIMKIFDAPQEKVNKKVFYVGDKPINLYAWVNGFSNKLKGKNVRIVPRSLIRILGYAGDVLSLFKIKFPIKSSRFTSMTQDYLTPMEATFEALGSPPYSLEEGIDATVKWLNKEYKD